MYVHGLSETECVTNKENSFKMLVGEGMPKRSKVSIALSPAHTNTTTEMPKVSRSIGKLKIF